MFSNFVCIAFLFVCLSNFSAAHELKFTHENILQNEHIDVLSVSTDTKADGPITHGEDYFIQNATACDCGENSIGCKLVEDRKVCNCKEGFAQGINGVCVETCNETQRCENGGSCLQHVCLCLPGTSGPFCETILDCLRNDLCAKDEYTDCSYDVDRQQAYCRCRIYEYRFDEASKTCRSCLCTDWSAQYLGSFSYCDYQQGQQVCVCTEGYSYNPRFRECQLCNCDSNSTWCAFDKDGTRMCGCDEGYYSTGYSCYKCLSGEHGICDPDVLFPSSVCDDGYARHRGLCVECTCGKYGRCLYDDKNKQIGCDCDSGYAEKSGKCEKCYCGDNINCTFDGDRKICGCDSGYEESNGFCKDINECEKHNPCKESMVCINLLGSYECVCKEGYQPVVVDIKPYEICQDIDECQNSSVCDQPNTFCENTVGSFKCICKSGFVSRGVLGTSSLCEESTAKSIYTTIAITAFVSLIATGTVVYYVKKTFLGNRSEYKHELN